jgi:uncharacterized protein (DUF1778 family)
MERIVLPAEAFDRLVAELERPAKVNPRLLAAARRVRRMTHR